MTLISVNGSLTVLSPYVGFRKYVQAKAVEIGITGSIQRCHHHDMRIQFEGTVPQVQQFTQFLSLCVGQGMIETIDPYHQRTQLFRAFNNFAIVRDFSRTVANGGKVIKGECSLGDEYDKLSEFSANIPILLGNEIEDNVRVSDCEESWFFGF